MPAVFLNGPRQAGKSTLVRHIAQTYLKADYVTFDDITTLSAAANDPEGFLRQFTKPVIIDEVQMVPEIFRVLKLLIDERRAHDHAGAYGRFLLTGSANIMALPKLADALVGRMAVLSLFPFSAVESLGNGRPVINGWFDQEIAFKKGDALKSDQRAMGEIIHKTTYPEIATEPEKSSALWLDGYLTTLLQRDVRQLAEIEKIPALPNIVKILAARAGGLLNDADCARDAKLNAVTYRRYRTLLQQLFLITLVPPWYRNIGKRLVKSPKLFFADTALLCHQLGVNLESLQRQNPGLFGHVLENFVASELTKQLSTIIDGGALYHYRTHDNKEVDFIIERRNGKLIGVEVKSRDSVGPDDFSGLKTLREHAGKNFSRGIVLYLGRDTVPFSDDMVAMPLESMWKFNMKISYDGKDEVYIDGYDGSVFFWANYGDNTRVRCRVLRKTIEDVFVPTTTEEQRLALIREHFDDMSPLFGRKIIDGQIDVVSEGGLKVRQVTLTARDLASKNYRRL
ncbi:MAG: ATP-binding protein [Alphaproteobacteria bacterium]|nr:ATP-binding protein [Alphaproteobacteria bacterium]